VVARTLPVTRAERRAQAVAGAASAGRPRTPPMPTNRRSLAP
jgi:hypothetical protein